MDNVEYLSSLGCCPRCVLVYHGVRDADLFLSHAAASLALQRLHGSAACADGVSAAVSPADGVTTLPEDTVCISCLGLLQNSCCSVAAVEQVCAPTRAAGYDAACFSLSVCLPVSVTARSHVIAARLSQHCGTPVTKEQRAGLTAQLKDAWKSAVSGSAAAVLGKQCSAGEAPLSVPVTACYDGDAQECHAFMMASGYSGPKRKRQRNRKHKHYSYGQHKESEQNGDCGKDSSVGASASVEFHPPSGEDESGAVGEAVGEAALPEYSRQAVEGLLSGLSVEQVVARCPLPPAPDTPLTLVPDTPNRASVFVAGRYRKYSRELSQTPWLLNGELKSPSSVEELIAGPLMPVLGAAELKFLSSGREDVDVRCLGRGRPFALEVLNPRVATLEAAQLSRLQQEINSGTKDISVTDLQMVDKEATSVLRYNTEDKVKNYCALCAVRGGGGPVTDDLLQKLHGLAPLTVQQETPLRVLHRRPLLTRPRVVHRMTAEKVNDSFFKVHMRTEAGTYIKELVHGDFGRTVPSLSLLLGRPVDILALDVTEVEVDWPPTVGGSD